ncbi:MAG TPA: HD domain-containing protein [Negativicutes bacterium]|nr:HD domain-containing protein [Negativicutes bacterium]
MNNDDSTESLSLLFGDYSNDILMSSGMQYEKTLQHHGEISCYDHSVAVACLSIKLAEYFHCNIDMKSMVRGALLHDYFLYDWHVAHESHHLHGFYHAKCALKNAECDFSLSDIERDIIVKHMFPLNPQLPQYMESLIVTVADKVCATREVLRNIFKIQMKRDKNGVH